MRGVTGAGREAYQHANSVPSSVGREQLAFDAGRHLFPFRLRPLRRGRQDRLLAGLLGDAKREACLERCSRTKHIARPGNKSIEQRAEAFHFALTLRARGDMSFGHGSLAGRQRLSHIGARYLAVLAAVLLERTHGFALSTISMSRSLCNPERMRVLMVPSGWFSRAAASACVRPPKNVVSMAWRSSGVRTANAARSNSPCSRNWSTSLGSAATSDSGWTSVPWLRFFRLSKRRRSIARERAWFMIQPSTVPFAAS